MKLNYKNAAKMASLSALGVGVLTVGAEDADASIIYNPTLAKVGFDATFTSSFEVTFSGANGFHFKTGNATTGTASRGFRNITFGGAGGVKFGFGGAFSTLRLFSAGNTLGAAALGAAGRVASRYWSDRSDSARNLSTGNAPFTSQEYALFDFACPTSGTCYGWVGLSQLSIAQIFYGAAGGSGPDLTIDGYAYDTTPGQELPAGDIGPAPEPGTFALTGLAALALGAVGVRRWRAARRARPAA